MWHLVFHRKMSGAERTLHLDYSVEIQLPQFSFCRLFASICVRFALLRTQGAETKTRMRAIDPTWVFERQTKSHNKNQSKYNFSIHNSIFVDFDKKYTHAIWIENWKKNMNIVELRSRLAGYLKFVRRERRCQKAATYGFEIVCVAFFASY